MGSTREAQTEVVVLGGGYAGVMAANRLSGRADVAVTLVNARPRFVERIRLHQLVCGSDDAVVDYRTVLGRGVRLVVGRATRIEPEVRRVELASGTALPYDFLVYAVGSGSAESHVPGVAEHAFPLASLEEAERLRVALAALPASAPVVVVGGGPTGIEVATELAELAERRSVTLTTAGPLGPYLHPRGRDAVARCLTQLGVDVAAGAPVTAVAADHVQLADGRILRSGLTVWTAGFGVADLARRSGLRTDAAGRLLTDETLTSLDSDRVVAAGDSAAPSGLPFRMSCQAAGPLGAHAGDTVARRLSEADPAPVALGFLGQCVSLGRRTGLVQLAHRDDTPRAHVVRGRLAARVKETVCRATVTQLRLEARFPGSVNLPRRLADPTRSERVEAARAAALVP